MEKCKVGFVGLGNMGFPMAKNLLTAGYTVYGVDVNEKSEEKLAQLGGKVGYTNETLANEVSIIFSSLPTPQIVESVYLGSEGLIENAVGPLILVDFSTVSPDLNQKIAQVAKEQNIQYLGAPVSGSVSGAQDGTLSVMLGGEKEVYDSVLPYLEPIGQRFFHVGEDHGSGSIVKLINNLMLGIHTQAVAEALNLADVAGLDHDVVYNIIDKCTGQSATFTRNYQNFIVKDEYREGSFTNALLLKDLKLAKHTSDMLGSQLPFGDKLIDYLEESIDDYTDQDIAAMYVMLNKQRVKKS